MTPESSVRWLTDSLAAAFPLRLFRDEVDSRPARKPVLRRAESEELKRLVYPPGDRIPAPGSTRRWEGEIRLNAAGFGGQGVLYLGETIAAAGMRSGDHVSWLPSYGPEMRGGTAHCHVIVSSDCVGSPIVERATHLVAMNAPSLARFESEVAEGGMILFDSSLIESQPTRSDVSILAVPATKTADGLGSARVANMVLLGALIALTGHPTPDTVIDVIAGEGGKPELLALNRQALAVGVELALAAADETTPWAV
jgi:Pyruvate/2-oxoacid:ferredoxin oxidoreductase gamma subunit